MATNSYRLGDICDVTWGDTKTTKSSYVDDGFTAYSASGPDGFLPYADYSTTGVVLSAIGAQAGRTWLARGHWSCIKNTIRILASSDVVSIDYLYWATLKPGFWPIRGSAQPFISQADARGICINLPSLTAQKAIAEVLGALDDKIAASTKLAATADDLAATISSRAFAAGLEVSLSDIAEITMGSSPEGASFNESGQGSVFYQGIRDFGLRYPNERVWTDAPLRMARKLDTLLSVRAPVGRANLASEAVCIGRGIASLHPRHGTPYTLFHAVKNSTVWHQFNSEGTVFGSINRRQLESSRLRWLPAEALEAHEARLRSLEHVIRSNMEMSKALADTRDALLPQLMSGKVGVKHAEEVVAAAI